MRLLLVSLLLLAGCKPSPLEVAPTSPLTLSEAVEIAKRIQNGDRRYQLYATPSGSMQPIFGIDSTLIIYRSGWAYTEIQEGQIALRVDDNALVNHRLVKITKDGWVMQGQANPSYDAERLTPENLAGIVVAVIYYTP